MNAHPEFNPYALFDVIALHPYYWTLFSPEGRRLRKLTFVPPSLMTYGPGGTISSIAVPQGRNFPVWWTEFGELLRLQIGNTQEDQAKRFHDILDQAIADNRRKQFPLGLVTWFSLRDRGCPSRAVMLGPRPRQKWQSRKTHQVERPDRLWLGGAAAVACPAQGPLRLQAFCRRSYQDRLSHRRLHVEERQ